MMSPELVFRASRHSIFWQLVLFIAFEPRL